MAHRIQNPDFFKQKPEEKETPVETTSPSENISENPSENEIKQETTTEIQSGESAAKAEDAPKAEELHMGEVVKTVVQNSARTLETIGYKESAVEIQKIVNRAERERFTIAVVGEFNKGKSTFINRFLKQDIVPTGNLPTTAIMTRIRYHKANVLAVFDARNQKVFEGPLTESAWDGLTAKNFGGTDFQGTAFVGVSSDWLKKTNVELIDTPGAGDLNESRMRVLSDALLGCDGVVIAVDANQALSLSEKLFIEERLMTRKLPFMMMILTKLDQVNENERTQVIQFVKRKLNSWKFDIPVFVPDTVSGLDDSLADCIGMDKVTKQIEEWIACPERTDLIEKWVLGKTEDIVSQACSSLREKNFLLETKNQEEREKLLEEKEKRLVQAELVWGDLELEMQKRCTSCYEMLVSKIDEFSETITERLKYEAAHSNVPSQWWKDDFPYRAKIELTNLSMQVETIASRQIQEDVRWYSNAIEKTFRSTVLYKHTTISEKEMFGDFSVGDELQFENVDKQRNLVRVGTAVLSISGFALFSALHFLPMIATMGVGTGSAILSERFFKKKVEEQRTLVQKEIARCVPIFIQNSLAESEQRLQTVYQDIIQEAKKSEADWLAAQKAAIQNVKQSDSEIAQKRVAAAVEKLEQQLTQIHDIA